MARFWPRPKASLSEREGGKFRTKMNFSADFIWQNCNLFVCGTKKSDACFCLDQGRKQTPGFFVCRSLPETRIGG